MKFTESCCERRAPGSLGKLQNGLVSGMDRLRQRLVDDGFEHHDRLMLIQQHELRIDIGFNRKLMQQTRTESVNRRDEGPVQSAFGTKARLALLVRQSTQQSVYAIAHALTHFIRCAVRESDGDDILNRSRFGAQNFQVALDQHERLARARAGSY